MQNYFEILNLPTQFLLDIEQLENNYRTLSTIFHPDRAASASGFEQKQMMMAAAQINEAYRTLVHPLNRAAYLLQLQHINADDPHKTQFSPDFLMQQMIWREALEEPSERENAITEIQSAYQSVLNNLQTAFNINDWEMAADWVRQGRFLDKLLTSTV